jgi:hypothetical protein
VLRYSILKTPASGGAGGLAAACTPDGRWLACLSVDALDWREAAASAQSARAARGGRELARGHKKAKDNFALK